MTDDPTAAVDGTPAHGPDAAGIVVGSVVALAGGTFLLQPFVGWIAVGAFRVRPVALSAVVLAAGFCLGGVLFLRQGRRLLGIGHAGMGGGWGLSIAATATGSGILLVGGVGLIAGTALFLVAESRKRGD